MIPSVPIDTTVEPRYADFLAALSRAGFTGEIHTDYSTRLVASTDNSIYQVVPQAVLFPLDRGDVAAIGRVAGEARFRGIRFAPRGAGTGTNGGSLGTGICVDVSKHMNRVLAYDADAGLVRVEPGVVLDQLNAYLRPYGVFFAPHVAPSDRATIGGMISNDSCGQGSRLYGRTSRHVDSLDLVLSDGSTWTTRDLPEDGGTDGLPGRIREAHRVVTRIVRERSDLIRERFPIHDRFLTGYDLAHVSRDGRIDLSALVCGSEGTLAFVVEACLRVVPIPAHRRLVVAMYGSFDDALAAAGELLESEPSAIETIDPTVLGLARQDIVWDAVADHFPAAGAPSVAAVNLVELCDSSEETLSRRVEQLRDSATGRALRVVSIQDDAQTRAFWQLRNRGVGLLGNMPGARRPVAFVEDCAVPPERLAGFVADLRELFDRDGLVYGMYGHVDVGCLHVRPALDLRDPEDERRLRRVSDRVFELVRSYGGVFWGEHGKGMRSQYNRDAFGPELYQEIRRIKEAFDPHDQLNPGKVATPASGADTLIEVGAAPLRGARDREIAPVAQERFESAIACNGNAACLTWDVDRAMCPSIRVAGDRVQSPKGRATVMREWLRRLSQRGWDGTAPGPGGGMIAALDPRPRLRRAWSTDDFSHEVYAAFAGCLSCKACVAECPIHVDIPRFKAEFLEAYHQRYPRPRSDYLVAAMESGLPYAPPRVFNALAPILSRAAGLIDAPRLAPRSAGRRVAELGAERVDAGWEPDTAGPPAVALIPDAFTHFFDPEPFVACYEILRLAGARVGILPYRPSGKSHHVKGFLAEFRAIAVSHYDRLAGLSERGIGLICVEPAIALLFRQEYASLGRDLPVLLPQEWLSERPLRSAAPSGGEPYLLLGHCTESTTAMASSSLWRAVFAGAGLDLEIPQVGCCGMAGAFGHERSHYDESRSIFDASWRHHIGRVDPARLLATGYSCRAQVARFAGYHIRHPLEVLRARLLPDPTIGSSR